MEQGSSEQGANDWKTVGADLMRLKIGSWPLELQFRPSRVVLNSMFTFVDSAIGTHR